MQMTLNRMKIESPEVYAQLIEQRNCLLGTIRRNLHWMKLATIQKERYHCAGFIEGIAHSLCMTGIIDRKANVAISCKAWSLV